MSVILALLVIMALLGIIDVVCLIRLVKDLSKKEINKEECPNENYVEPKIKKLTEDQIKDIHLRGKITPAEKVKEWEDIGVCAPGDAIGSASWRCDKFKNCHDCLVDYANENDEYISFSKIQKINNID